MIQMCIKVHMGAAVSDPPFDSSG